MGTLEQFSKFVFIPLLFVCIVLGVTQREVILNLNQRWRTSSMSTNMSRNSSEQLNEHRLPRGIPNRISKNRIAVCIVGVARTIHFKAVHENILQRAIVPLQNAGYKPDIFFVTRMKDEAAPTQMVVKTNLTGIQQAITKFNATKIIEYTKLNESNIDINRFIPQVDNQHAQYKAPEWCEFEDISSHTVHFSHTLYRTKQCLDIVRKHEIEKGFSYSWIYRIRPDVIYLDDIPTPDKLSKNKFYGAPWSNKFCGAVAKWWKNFNNISDENKIGTAAIGDQLSIASRKIAQLSYNAFDIVQDCDAYKSPERNSESILRLWLMKHHIPYEKVPVLWDIVRDHPNPFCNFIEYVETPNTTKEERKQRCREFQDSNADFLPGYT